jgi:hypothetical protein
MTSPHEKRKDPEAETSKKLDAILSDNAVDCASCGEIIHIKRDDYIRLNGQEVHTECLEEDMQEVESP